MKWAGSFPRQLEMVPHQVGGVIPTSTGVMSPMGMSPPPQLPCQSGSDIHASQSVCVFVCVDCVLFECCLHVIVYMHVVCVCACNILVIRLHIPNYDATTNDVSKPPITHQTIHTIHHSHGHVCLHTFTHQTTRKNLM